MNVEERIANDPYFPISAQLAHTLVQARCVVAALIGSGIAVLVWWRWPLDPVTILLLILSGLLIVMGTWVNGIGAPRRRMRRQALALLRHGHYDDRTLNHMERMARIGANIPWMRHQAALVAAINDYRQEATQA